MKMKMPKGPGPKMSRGGSPVAPALPPMKIGKGKKLMPPKPKACDK